MGHTKSGCFQIENFKWGATGTEAEEVVFSESHCAMVANGIL